MVIPDALKVLRLQHGHRYCQLVRVTGAAGALERDCWFGALEQDSWLAAARQTVPLRLHSRQPSAVARRWSPALLARTSSWPLLRATVCSGRCPPAAGPPGHLHRLEARGGCQDSGGQAQGQGESSGRSGGQQRWDSQLIDAVYCDALRAAFGAVSYAG